MADQEKRETERVAAAGREMQKKQPKYILLYRKIAESIASGTYKTGEKLPSKRTIADKYGMSLVTVEHALETLEDEGYIISKERSGYYVSYDTEHGGKNISQMLRSRPDIIREPMRAEDLPGEDFPFNVWAKTVRQVLSDRRQVILQRSPNIGQPELRRSISEFLDRNRGIRCDPERIVIGAGSAYLYERLIHVLGKDRIYAIESPSYHMIERVYKAEDAVVEMLKIGSEGILSEELNRTKATVLHVTPYRSFPSGATAQAGKRAEYIAWASKPGRLIIEDDVESEFSIMNKTFDTLFTLSGIDNVIYMNTFSVTLSPALRISYMILPEYIAAEYEKKAGFYPCPVPTFEQLILSEFISSGNFERHINRVRRIRRASVSGHGKA